MSNIPYSSEAVWRKLIYFQAINGRYIMVLLCVSFFMTVIELFVTSCLVAQHLILSNVKVLCLHDISVPT